MNINNSTTLETLAVVTILLVLLASNGLPTTRAFAVSEEDDKITASFSTKIGLTEGKLKLSYSSDTSKLELEYYGWKGEKEYELSFSSEKRLGLLIVDERGQLSYSLEVLKTGEDWEPFDDKFDATAYRKKARLSQKPVWEVLVVEKSESHLATSNSERII